MSASLRSDDSIAVDLLLDHAAKAQAHVRPRQAAVFANVDPQVAPRLSRARDLLALLELLPTEEPSADLVAKTLRLVEKHPKALMSPDGAIIVNPIHSQT